MPQRRVQTVSVNDPADPLVKGSGCGPVRCRAELDFLDVAVARDGTAWASFVDACDGADACGGSGTGIVGRVVGGPPLVGTIAQQTPAIASAAVDHGRRRAVHPGAAGADPRAQAAPRAGAKRARHGQRLAACGFAATSPSWTCGASAVAR